MTTKFTDEERLLLQEMITTGVNAAFAERKRRALEGTAEEAQKAAERQSRLFLITLGQRIAIPDEKGRAVCVDLCYGRVPVDDNGKPSMFGSRIEVVAYGDGKLLDKPVAVNLAGGILALVEVSESILANLA